MRGRTPEGRIEVDGTYNVRDIGGLPTTTGLRVATGHVIRSASLDRLTDDGIDSLRRLDVRTIIDLRSHEEVAEQGRLPNDAIAVRWEHLASSVAPPSGDDERSRRLRDHPDPMSEVYVEMATTMGPQVARGFRILADPMNHTAVVHCASGKDRTGFFVLLLHLVLGVAPADAIAHYRQDADTTERAEVDMRARYAELGDMPPEKVRRMAGTNDRWILGALDAVGGATAVPDWLAHHGCDPDQQARLRSLLTVA